MVLSNDSKSNGSKAPTAYCPECRVEADLVADFEAPQGIDPRMRTFECDNCGCVFYKIVKGLVGV